MSMFQPQNYGADFVNSMSATAGMLNDRRKLDMAEKQQAEAEKRYAAEAETRTLQNEGLRQDNAKKSADVAREKALQDFLPRADALLQGKLDPKEQARLAGVTEQLMKDVPYAPSRVEDIPEYRKKLGTLIQGVESIRTLPPSNYVYSRADNVPEINNLLDNYQGVLSQDRLGKTFTDPDGSITGKAGGSYQTTGVGGFMMASGEGNKAGFVPLFSVAGEDGKPLVKPDGKPVMVPATEGATNSPQDKLRVVTPEELLTKAGFAYKLMDVADQLGLSDAEKRKAYVSGQLNTYRGEDGAKALAKSLEPEEEKITFRDPTHNGYDKNGKLVVAGTPKPKEDKAPTRSEFERDGYKVTEEYQGGGKWKVVARSKIKETGGSGSGGSQSVAGGKGGGGESKTVAAITKEYQALKKQRNAQFAKDTAELRRVNASRKDENGMPALPMSFEEYFGGKESPAHEAITQNMYQLRDVAKNSYGYDLVNMKPMGNAAPAKGMAAPAQVASVQKAAPAQQPKAKPITATNKSTGQRIVSYDNGASWQPLK